METLRKTLTLMLVLSISIFVTGCSGDDADTSSESTEATEPEDTETGIEDIKGRFDEFEE